VNQSRIWLFLGLYLIIIAFLAFGQHSPEATATLLTIGLKSTSVQRIETQKVEGGLFTSSPGGVRQYIDVAPNIGGVLLYTIAGVAISIFSLRTSRR